jgi:hypothetical protein
MSGDVAREVFLSDENISWINGSLHLCEGRRVRRAQLASWYDAYMCYKDIEPSKIDDFMTWCNFMNENYLREYRGHHILEQAKAPFLPFDGIALPQSKRIQHTSASGKHPKFVIESAVKDGVDGDGRPVVQDVQQEVRMFLPVRPWRFGRPIPLWRVQQSQNGSRLIDRDYSGTLYDWELLGRPHTKRDMSIFYTTQNHADQRMTL